VPAYAAEADQAQRLAPQLAAQRRRPLARVHRRVGAGDVPQHGQNQPDGQLGGSGGRAAAGGASHHDTALGRRLKVDVRRPAAGLNQQLRISQLAQQLGAEPRPLAIGDQHLEASQLGHITGRLGEELDAG